MQFTRKLRIPLDSLDAAVMKCLDDCPSLATFEFTRHEIPPTTVIYMLGQHQLKHLGRVELAKVGEEEIEISVIGPLREPDRSPRSEELDALAAISSPFEREAAKIALAGKIRAESDKDYRRRRLWHERVIQVLVSELARYTPSKKDKQRLGAIAKQVLEAAGMPRGPTTKIQDRAEVMRRLKEQHPKWPQYKVAREAGKELGEIVTTDALRYVYRVMGLKWERADRIR